MHGAESSYAIEGGVALSRSGALPSSFDMFGVPYNALSPDLCALMETTALFMRGVELDAPEETQTRYYDLLEWIREYRAESALRARYRDYENAEFA